MIIFALIKLLFNFGTPEGGGPKMAQMAGAAGKVFDQFDTTKHLRRPGPTWADQEFWYLCRWGQHRGHHQAPAPTRADQGRRGPTTADQGPPEDFLGANQDLPIRNCLPEFA